MVHVYILTTVEGPPNWGKILILLREMDVILRRAGYSDQTDYNS